MVVDRYVHRRRLIVRLVGGIIIENVVMSSVKPVANTEWSKNPKVPE